MGRLQWVVAASIAAVVIGGAAALGHMKPEDLPAGPIRDRHVLMEQIGDEAEKIGKALKKKDDAAVATQAAAMAENAKKVVALFPAGSTHEKSRALPAIWTDFASFEKDANALAVNAAALATTAKSGGDVGAAAKEVFGTCKSCHTAFRKPDEK